MWLQDSVSFGASSGCASLRGSWTGEFSWASPLSPHAITDCLIPTCTLKVSEPAWTSRIRAMKFKALSTLNSCMYVKYTVLSQMDGFRSSSMRSTERIAFSRRRAVAVQAYKSAGTYVFRTTRTNAIVEMKRLHCYCLCHGTFWDSPISYRFSLFSATGRCCDAGDIVGSLVYEASILGGKTGV